MGKKKVLTEEDIAKQLILPGPGQVLGRVERLLGYDRLLVKCLDGETRVCSIRGKLKRRVWTKLSDWVLVEPWDFQQEKGNILWRYTKGQVQILEGKGLIPKT